MVYVPAGGGLVELRFEDPYAWLWRAEPLPFLGSIILAYVVYSMLLKRCLVNRSQKALVVIRTRSEVIKMDSRSLCATRNGRCGASCHALRHTL